MNLTPIGLYLFLLLIIPLGMCFWMWKVSSNWLITAGICAVLSWIYFNFWMMKLDSPDNGFVNAVYFVTGWFWLLPIFGIGWAIFRLLEIRLANQQRQKVGSIGFIVCCVVTGIIVAWNLFGGMSEKRAIIEARYQLKKRGYEPKGRVVSVYEGGHWVIRYPDTDFREIRLTRNGGMSWIGGPG